MDPIAFYSGESFLRNYPREYLCKGRNLAKKVYLLFSKHFLSELLHMLLIIKRFYFSTERLVLFSMVVRDQLTRLIHGILQQLQLRANFQDFP